MNLARKTYTTRREKTIDFVIGFVGWFVLNGFLTGIGWAVTVGLGALLSQIQSPDSTTVIEPLLGVLAVAINCLPWLINIGLLVFFGLMRHWIALVALAAFGTVLLILLCIAVVFSVWCFTGFRGLGG